MKVDTKSLCGHIRAVFSKSHLPSEDAQALVGYLCNLDPNRFKDACNEMQHIFGQALLGNFNLEDSELQYFPLGNSQQVRVNFFNEEVLGSTFRSKAVNSLLSLPGSDPLTLETWGAMTNLKSALIIDKPTRDERYEAYNRITEKPQIEMEITSCWLQFLDQYIPLIIKREDVQSYRKFDPLWNYPEGTKTGITCYGGELVKVRRDDSRLFDIKEQMRHKIVNEICRKYPQEFAEAVFLGYETPFVSFDIPEPYDHDLSIGSVQIAPKVAQKPRIVFQTLLILDSMTRPLFHKLETIIDRLPTQGVFSHEDARKLVQDILTNRFETGTDGMIHSFDQSAFTDRFSYDEIQRPVLVKLRQLGVILDYDLACCDATCRGVYESNILKKNSTVSFNGSGTPMGTPPSFMLASLSNDLLAAFSFYRAYGDLPNPYCPDPKQAKWLVVGDDIIIFDDKVAEEYRRLCSQIGLKINESKSISSDYLAEFCGKYITRHGIVPKLKLSPISGHDALKELMDYYPRDAIIAGWPEYEPDTELMAYLPEPFGKRKIEDLPMRELPIMDAYSKALRLANELFQLVKEERIFSENDLNILFSRKKRVPQTYQEGDLEEHRPEPVIEPLVRSRIQDAKELVSSLTSASNRDDIYRVAEELDRIYQMIFPNDSEKRRLEKLASHQHVALPRKHEQNNLNSYSQLLAVASLPDQSENDRKEDNPYEHTI